MFWSPITTRPLALVPPPCQAASCAQELISEKVPFVLDWGNLKGNYSVFYFYFSLNQTSSRRGAENGNNEDVDIGSMAKPHQ